MGTLTLQNVGGTAEFHGGGDGHDADRGQHGRPTLSLTGGGTVLANAMAPTNTGTLTLGNADADTLAFNGGSGYDGRRRGGDAARAALPAATTP